MAQGSKKKYTSKQNGRPIEDREGLQKTWRKQQRSGTPRMGDRKQIR